MDNFQPLTDRELKNLRERYRSKNDIIQRLSEINVDMTTYRFLGELFFYFLMNESEKYSHGEFELSEIETKRFEILEMYELALAAKALQMRKDF